MRTTRRGFFALLSTAALAATGVRFLMTERRLPSLHEIIAKTLKERRTEIAQNVIAHNALLAKMKAGQSCD